MPGGHGGPRVPKEPPHGHRWRVRPQRGLGNPPDEGSVGTSLHGPTRNGLRHQRGKLDLAECEATATNMHKQLAMGKTLHRRA
jgi:hypothetical protein